MPQVGAKFQFAGYAVFVEQIVYFVGDIQTDFVLLAYDDVAAYAFGFCGFEQWHERVHVAQVGSEYDKAACLDGSIHSQPDGEAASHREAAQDDVFGIDWILVQQRFVVLLDFISGGFPVVPYEGVDSSDL